MGGKNSKLGDEVENRGAENFLAAERKKYGEIDLFFDKYDYNNDRMLDETEFKEAIKSYIKIHPEKETNLQELLNSLDMNNNSSISKDDFRKIMTVYLSEEISLENMIDVFKCFDKNMEGEIGANEIRHVFSKLGLNLTKDEANDLINEADSDGDHVMDFEEFLKIMIAK